MLFEVIGSSGNYLCLCAVLVVSAGMCVWVYVCAWASLSITSLICGWRIYNRYFEVMIFINFT